MREATTQQISSWIKLPCEGEGKITSCVLLQTKRRCLTTNGRKSRDSRKVKINGSG